MKCPKCGSTNPDGATRCQWIFCGYVFADSARQDGPPGESLSLVDLLLRSTPHTIATSALMGACTLVFLSQVIAGASPLRPAPLVLLDWGGNFPPFTATGQWWRLLTAIFLHAGILHLAANMWCLWNLGQMTERLYGSVTFLLIYVISGMCGSVVSSYFSPLSVVVGASGAIFGLAGAMLAFFVVRRIRIAAAVYRDIYASLAVFLLWNIFIGFTLPHVSNSSHITGLLAGFCCGLFLTRPLPTTELPPRDRLVRVSVAAAILIVVCAAGIAPRIAQVPYALTFTTRDSFRSLTEFTDGHRLAGKGDRGAALDRYQRAADIDPSNPQANHALGAALLEKGLVTAALKHLLMAFDADPANPRFHLDYARGLLVNGEFRDAADHLEQIADEHSESGNEETALLALSALGFEAIALLGQRRYRETIGLCDDVVAAHGDADSIVEKRIIARVMLTKAFALVDLGRPSDAIAQCLSIHDYTGGEGDDEIRTVVARSLLLESAVLIGMKRYARSLDTCNRLLGEFAESATVERRRALAEARIQRGLSLFGLGRDKEGRDQIENVVRKFADSPEPRLESVAAMARQTLADVPRALKRIAAGAGR